MAKAATVAVAPSAPARSKGVAAPSISMLVPSAKGDVKEALADSGASRSTHYMVPTDFVRIQPGFNIRLRTPEYEKNLLDLKSKILRDGFAEDKPITAYVGVDKDTGKSVLYVLDGHRRLEATRLANAELDDESKITKIPVILASQKATDVQLLSMVVKSADGSAQLTMVDRAFAVKRLMKQGISDEEIVKELQISSQHLRDIKLLLDARPDVRKIVQEGRMKPSTAVEIIRKSNKNGADPKGLLAEATIVGLVEKAAKMNAARAEAEKGGTVATSPGRPKKEVRATAALAAAEVTTVKDAKTGKVKEIIAKPRVIKTSWSATAGDKLKAGDTNFEFFRNVGGDEAWFKVSDRTGAVTILETISFDLKVTRPAVKAEAGAPATKKADAGEPVPAPKKVRSLVPVDGGENVPGDLIEGEDEGEPEDEGESEDAPEEAATFEEHAVDPDLHAPALVDL